MFSVLKKTFVRFTLLFFIISVFLTILVGKRCVLVISVQEFIEIETSDLFHMIIKLIESYTLQDL